MNANTIAIFLLPSVLGGVGAEGWMYCAGLIGSGFRGGATGGTGAGFCGGIGGML